MSLLNKQITELIKNKISYKDHGITAEIKFDKNFIGFIGHFPDNPVLPGVIIIKVMTQMYELFNNKRYVLSQIKQAKFIEPVLSDTTVSIFIKSDKNPDGVRLDGKMVRTDKIIAKISLVLQG